VIINIENLCTKHNVIVVVSVL